MWKKLKNIKLLLYMFIIQISKPRRASAKMTGALVISALAVGAGGTMIVQDPSVLEPLTNLVDDAFNTELSENLGESSMVTQDLELKSIQALDNTGDGLIDRIEITIHNPNNVDVVLDELIQAEMENPYYIGRGWTQYDITNSNFGVGQGTIAPANADLEMIFSAESAFSQLPPTFEIYFNFKYDSDKNLLVVRDTLDQNNKNFANNQIMAPLPETLIPIFDENLWTLYNGLLEFNDTYAQYQNQDGLFSSNKQYHDIKFSGKIDVTNKTYLGFFVKTNLSAMSDQLSFINLQFKLLDSNDNLVIEIQTADIKLFKNFMTEEIAQGRTKYIADTWTVMFLDLSQIEKVLTLGDEYSIKDFQIRFNGYSNYDIAINYFFTGYLKHSFDNNIYAIQAQTSDP